MMQGGRTLYTIEINRNGRREEVEFEGPSGLSNQQIEALAGQNFGAGADQDGGPPIVVGQGYDPQQIENTPGSGGRAIPDWLHRFSPAAATALEMPAQGLAGIGQGAGEVLDNAAELLQGGYNNTLGHLFGRSDSATRTNQQGGGFEGLARGLGEGTGAGRFVGNVGASALLTRGMGGPVTQGAASGALMSDAEDAGGLLRDAAVGGIGGAVGDRLLRGVSSAIAPHVDDAARFLWDRGVRMTPGQVIPGLRRTEDRLTSRPFVGDRIVAGRQQSYEDFNVAALDEITAQYNQIAPQIGRAPIVVPRRPGSASVRVVGDQLSNRYEALVPQLRFVPDEQLGADVQALRSTLGNGSMSPAAIEQFETIIRNQVMSRIGWNPYGPASASRALAVSGTHFPTRPISGETYRQIERSLGHQIARFSRSSEPDHQAMAEALEQVQVAFQSALQRANPQHAAELQALNAGWANLVRVEGAASGARGGLFSPLQFRAAVRRGDNSTRRRAMARGEARMQDLAEAGADVLPPEYPDSGTAGRSQMSPFDPRYWLGMGQGLAYGPSAQQALTNAYMYPRPQTAQSVADLLRRLPAPQMGAAGASALTGPFFRPVP